MPVLIIWSALAFIHTWLQPGVTNSEISQKPFKRFPPLRRMTTWLKPGVNNRAQLLTPTQLTIIGSRSLVRSQGTVAILLWCHPKALPDHLKEFCSIAPRICCRYAKLLLDVVFTHLRIRD